MFKTTQTFHSEYDQLNKLTIERFDKSALYCIYIVDIECYSEKMNSIFLIKKIPNGSRLFKSVTEFLCKT